MGVLLMQPAEHSDNDAVIIQNVRWKKGKKNCIMIYQLFFEDYLGLNETITFLLFLKAFLKGTLSRGQIELPLTRKCDQFTKAKEGETLRCPNSIDDGQMDTLVTYTKHSKFSTFSLVTFSYRFQNSQFLTLRRITHAKLQSFNLLALKLRPCIGNTKLQTAFCGLGNIDRIRLTEIPAENVYL